MSVPEFPSPEMGPCCMCGGRTCTCDGFRDRESYRERRTLPGSARPCQDLCFPRARTLRTDART